MCLHIKNMEFVKKQYETAIKQDVDIIEIEFKNGIVRYRDVFTVGMIVNRLEKEKTKGEL